MSSSQQLLLGEGAGGSIPVYIEDVFSTYLYTGNGTTQTITNGIDLSTKGGLIWQKDRVSAGQSHILCDTARGVNSFLRSDLTSAAGNNGGTDAVYAFNSNGFSTGTVNGTSINLSGDATASWTFREQPKFFDVQTWSPNGSGDATVAHSLNSVPGAVFIKKVSATSAWQVYHRSLATNNGLYLNTTDAAQNFGTWISVSSTQLSMSGYSAGTYIAYIFAHDAGGFGTTNTDNVISCGSFSTGAGGGATVTLGYEPQWLMIKSSSNTSAWYTFDSMRGWIVGGSSRGLSPNTANAEFNFGSSSLPTNPTATGFTITNGLLPASETWIYIAIRRGPMKVPTTGTSVFAPAFMQAAARYANRVQTGFPVDMTFMNIAGSTAAVEIYEYDRLRDQAFQTYSAANQQSNPFGSQVSFASNTGFVNASAGSLAAPSFNVIFLNFQRAPSFFDVVAYTGAGSGSGQSVTHNLGATPELLLVKNRTASAENWSVLITSRSTRVVLNATDAEGSPNQYFGGSSSYIAPTSSVFTVGPNGETGAGANTYVAYLFATCAGVSKVGSYTGTGALQTIPCGFTSGARFVLIKRVDSTGAWYVWDSTRGISASDDPYLLLNSTAPQVNNTNYVDTDTTGFKVTAAAPAAINSSASGATYIFLAIA